MPEIVLSEVVKNKVSFVPCIKCGSEDIDFNNCGYSSFDVAWGRCKKCKNEIKISPFGYNQTKKDIIKEWNQHNDPEILRVTYQKQISEIQKKIDELPTKNR